MLRPGEAEVFAPQQVSGVADVEARELGAELFPQFAQVCPARTAVQLAHAAAEAFAHDARREQQDRKRRRDPGRELQPHADDRMTEAIEPQIQPELLERQAVVVVDHPGSDQEHRGRQYGPDRREEQDGE